MRHVFKKEIGQYLNNPLGYIAVILFGVFANFFFIRDAFITGSVSMKSFFSFIPWLFLICIPALSMRSISEEKRMNTIELLLTLPLSETQIVGAKFTANLFLVFIGLILTMLLPLTLFFFSQIPLGEVIVGYLGSLLIGSSFLSVALFFSSTTKNQVVSFLFSVLTLLFITSMSSDLILSLLPRIIQPLFVYVSPLSHFQNFVKGIIDIRSLLYFVSLTFTFLFLSIIQLEKRD